MAGSWGVPSRGCTMQRAFRRVVGLSALGAVGLFAGAGAVLAATPQTPGPVPGSPEQMSYFEDTCRHELQRPPIGGGADPNPPRPRRGAARGAAVGQPAP